VDVWINRGTCLGLLSRHEEALKSFLEAENIGGPLSSQMRGAASALEKLGRKDEAIHCLDRCLANTATTDWDVLRDKAKLLVRFGRAAEALPIYMQLVAHAPKDAALMIERAKALEAAGKTLEARTALEAAQAVTPKPA
jgi:tetratricopeptide (TPR) repeat protein